MHVFYILVSVRHLAGLVTLPAPENQLRYYSFAIWNKQAGRSATSVGFSGGIIKVDISKHLFKRARNRHLLSMPAMCNPHSQLFVANYWQKNLTWFSSFKSAYVRDNTPDATVNLYIIGLR